MHPPPTAARVSVHSSSVCTRVQWLCPVARYLLGIKPTDAMKRVCPLLVMFSSAVVSAQNLVPNGSFEEYTECPSNFSHIDRVVGWMPFRVTPDYFNVCSPNDSAGVPLNILGYQAAATGVAYAGIWCYFDKSPANGREYMGIQLREPLSPGTPYHLSFKTVFASSGTENGYLPQFNCSGIGLRFAMSPFLEGLGWPVPNQAAIHLDHLITDSVGWTIVSGTYVPDSAYAYLVVGNFFDDQTILLDQFNPDGNIDGAYFYVDDVCVSENSNSCDFTGYHESGKLAVSLYPNPFGDHLRITGIPASHYPSRLTLWDMAGRECIALPLTRDGETVDLASMLFAGTYLVTIQTAIGRIGPMLLMHNCTLTSQP